NPRGKTRQRAGFPTTPRPRHSLRHSTFSAGRSVGSPFARRRRPPKGQEPKHREVLALFNTFTGGNRALDIPPNQVTTTESFVPLRQNARIENFQAHLPNAYVAVTVKATTTVQ